MNKAELQAIANEQYFPQYPNELVLIATKDGMFFTVKNIGAAKDHAEKIKSEIFRIGRIAVQPETVEVPTEQNTVAEIKAYLDAEEIEYESKATKAELLALIEEEETEE